MAEIGNRKERLRDYASFPEDFDLPRSKVATGLLPFAWDAPPRLAAHRARSASILP